MKLVRVKHEDVIHYGTLEDDVINLLSAAPWESGFLTNIQVPISEARLLAPCTPSKVVGLAINFPGATGLDPKAKEPLVFLKHSQSVIGPGDRIISPFGDMPVWGECEIGIVIGKKISKCSVEEAKNSVFGYVIGNDVSAENILNWDHHLPRSKSADTFCPLGPWIETDFNPAGKRIRGYHNGVLIRDGYADARLWAEPELLVMLSRWMTLEPGDVVLTGAPCRVIDRLYFKSGDVYRCEVDGLGCLENSFGVEFE